jgi:DNA-binding NarL/FixJ family response regulator
VSDPVRIVIADDHPPTRAGIVRALEGRGFVVCAEAHDARTAVEAALAHRPDAALIDIHMPGSGIAATEEITSRLPDVAVIMLTVSRNDADLFDALRAGAQGYLLKDINPDRLPDAILGVLAGEAAMPRGLVAHLIEEFRERGRRRRVFLFQRQPVDLTSREWEVLNLMRQGLSTAEISARLFITQATVRTHVAAILRKLHASSREDVLSLLNAEEQPGNALSRPSSRHLS